MNKSEQVEADIQGSKVCFRTIFDQTSQFIGLIKPDGTVVEVNQTIKPIKNESGQVILLISEGRDISERQLANAELKQRVAKGNQAVLKSERRWETSPKFRLSASTVQMYQ